MIAIDEMRCEVCGTCAGVCPADAVVIGQNRAYIIEAACTGCGACIAVCPVEAIADNSPDAAGGG